MFSRVLFVFLYGAIFISLFLIDHVLGNGFTDSFKEIYCKLTCFLKKYIKQELNQVESIVKENPVNFLTVLLEVCILTLTITFIRKYALYRRKDRIDHLLHDSRVALQQTNDFLEKWRLRRIIWNSESEANSYLDEEPTAVKTLKLEVPILHMAVVDTRGALRNQPERADAGDSVTHADSSFVSVTSLVDDDAESIPDLVFEECVEEPKTVDFKSRYLWDLMEEDSNFED